MIPTNDYQLENDPKIKEIIDSAIKQLAKDGQASFWWSGEYTLAQCTHVAKEFVKKGYYAKQNMFTNGRWQSVIISKKPLENFSSCAMYSVML